MLLAKTMGKSVNFIQKKCLYESIYALYPKFQLYLENSLPTLVEIHNWLFLCIKIV